MSDASAAGVVVVGGGQAGVQVADSIRAADADMPITVITDEVAFPYQRPPLSKSLLEEDLGQACLPLRPIGFFRDRRITLLGGVRVTAVDRDARTVGLDSGQEIPYEALVLATGARAREISAPGTRLDGVHTLRTLDQGTSLQATLRRASRVVVVGGGFIGLEVAGAAVRHGLSVTVLEAAPRVLERAVTPQASEWLTDFHLRCGVDVRLRTGLARMSGNRGRVSGVVTTRGQEIPCDAVLVGVGATPNVELAERAGLAVDNGIVVDASLRTGDPSIWAVGDCARFPCVHSGSPTRLESVQNATDQARCVAANVVSAVRGGGGEGSPYDSVPWFWSHQGSAKLQIAGVGDAADADVVVRRHHDSKMSFLCFEDGELTIVESINAPADHMAARSLLARRVRVTPEAAADVGVPLKSLLPS
ncbi:FAD-dependent oxidoreductase [Streptosporangium sp. NPDC051022]|uniref:NAD(P)/FAD-dependent oxidoreductase n=1 Tax=Streptosporangium sp. NPDC051022 TaxID=3155752 RepID=UPI003444518F